MNFQLTSFRAEPIFAPWETLKVRELPKPKVKKVPVYCTPPRKKNMKKLMDVLFAPDGESEGVAKKLFVDNIAEATPLEA
jgi:hypothetical protein